MYTATGAPGCFLFKARTSAAVIDSDKEQPASGAGSRTSLSGLRIFAVSAMKRTPQNTMVSASEAAPSLASL